MNFLRFFLIFHSICFQIVCDYKILVFSPTISASHVISNVRIADVLAKDGHQVTLLEVEYDFPLSRVNPPKFAKLWRVPGPFASLQADDLHDTLALGTFQTPNPISILQTFRPFIEEMNWACEKFITTQTEQLERLKVEKFDVIFTEQITHCGTGLAHLLDIPIHILLSSNPLPEYTLSVLGIPYASSWVPALMNSHLTDKMSIFQRLQNILLQTVGYFFVFDELDAMTEIYRKHFGQKFPDLRDILKESPFIFVSVDEFVEFPRPLFSNIVYIGGIGMDENEAEQIGTELPEPLKSEMAKGKKGVVFVSTGTVIRSLDWPQAFRQNLFDTFRHFTDYHFIISMELANALDNVFMAEWVPQIKLLNHPRLRLFISHSGYNSLMEAARAGIPMLTIPFFGDQYRNARVPERNGWGIAFEKSKLLEGNEEFQSVLEEILIKNAEYANKAKRIQKLILTKPFSAEQRLLKSIRFLEANGGRLLELLPESRNLSIVELYNLDLCFLFATFISFIFIIFLMVARGIRRLIKQFCKGENKKKYKKKIS